MASQRDSSSGRSDMTTKPDLLVANTYTQIHVQVVFAENSGWIIAPTSKNAESPARGSQ
jgi:ribosomal protein L18